MKSQRQMQFSKRMLIALTPVGMAIGLHEAWRLAGGLVVLMAVQLIILTVIAVAVARRIRQEER
jgi:hypothetical protein